MAYTVTIAGNTVATAATLDEGVLWGQVTG